MESIDQHLARIDQRLTRMERMLSMLGRAKNKENREDEWICEKEAAGILNWSPRHLRVRSKAGIIPIQCQSRKNRNFSYRKDQVLKFRDNPVYIR